MRCTWDRFSQDHEPRVEFIRNHPAQNGIEYLEVDPLDHTVIRLFFINVLPNDAYGLGAKPDLITITGGTRISGIRVIGAVPTQGQRLLTLKVDHAGDYSAYRLEIHSDRLDLVLRSIEFSFMASCPVDFDCWPEGEEAPKRGAEPALDYLAKDYASFRRMMLDLLPQLNPQFLERSPADVGIAQIELLAYYADRLSYLQDAVANEAFLDTARHRISARRHARLVDYRMHDGRNAWTYLHVAAANTFVLPRGTPVLTRVTAPLSGETLPPGAVIDSVAHSTATLVEDPASAAAVIFETAHDAAIEPSTNEMYLHTWGDEECCLPAGAVEAYVYAVDAGGAVSRPTLKKGDFVLLEEVRGGSHGEPAEADPAVRAVVRLVEDPADTSDPMFQDRLSMTPNGWRLRSADELPPRPPLPLLHLRWGREHALRLPFRLSLITPEEEVRSNLAVARGNIVLVDQGRTVQETAGPAIDRDSFRLPLAQRPLTMQGGEMGGYDSATGQSLQDRWEVSGSVQEMRPAVGVEADSPTGRTRWSPVSNLLSSSPLQEHFVAEVDNDGQAVLRFGDGRYGRRAAGIEQFRMTYRVGNGRSGNIGAESLCHLVLPAAITPSVTAVRNPIAGRDGTDPETIEEVRLRAPEEFHARQFRAVTEADYTVAARTRPDVDGAAASFRWTGSWYTVFAGIDPEDEDALVLEASGRLRFDGRFEGRMRTFLDNYRLAGYDLELRPPVFVPLELTLEVCAAAGHFRGDVQQAVVQALSSRLLPDGQRGFFHPDNFTFGQPVYLSRIYAAVEAVEGVGSAVVTSFRRYGRPEGDALATGVLTIGPWEVAQLENNPNFMEHGVLHITVCGGKV